MLDDLTVAQTKNRHVTESHRSACGLHAIHWAGMRALDQQLHNNIFTSVDKKFDLFTVIGKSYPKASCRRFDPFNTAAPVSEGIVSRKFLSIKLLDTIDLTFGLEDVAGFSDDISVGFHVSITKKYITHTT